MKIFIKMEPNLSDINDFERDIENFFRDYNINEIPTQSGTGLNKFYDTIHIYDTPPNNYGISRKIIKFEIKNEIFNSFYDAQAPSQEFFEEIFNNYVNSLSSYSKVLIFIDHSVFDKPLLTCFIHKSQIKPAHIYRLFWNAMQSKKNQGKKSFLFIYFLFNHCSKQIK